MLTVASPITGDPAQLKVPEFAGDLADRFLAANARVAKKKASPKTI